MRKYGEVGPQRDHDPLLTREGTSAVDNGRCGGCFRRPSCRFFYPLRLPATQHNVSVSPWKEMKTAEHSILCVSVSRQRTERRVLSGVRQHRREYRRLGVRDRPPTVLTDDEHPSNLPGSPHGTSTILATRIEAGPKVCNLCRGVRIVIFSPPSFLSWFSVPVAPAASCSTYAASTGVWLCAASSAASYSCCVLRAAGFTHHTRHTHTAPNYARDQNPAAGYHQSVCPPFFLGTKSELFNASAVCSPIATTRGGSRKPQRMGMRDGA